jgi:hypothetical protein
MEKKKIIQYILIIGGFLGAGIILYNGFFSGQTSSPVVSMVGGATSTTSAGILPYGPTFDYQKIDDLGKQGFVYGQVQYPTVSTSTEVGKASVADLIQPLPTGP